MLDNYKRWRSEMDQEDSGSDIKEVPNRIVIDTDKLRRGAGERSCPRRSESDIKEIKIDVDRLRSEGGSRPANHIDIDLKMIEVEQSRKKLSKHEYVSSRKLLIAILVANAVLLSLLLVIVLAIVI